jgi:predicted transcriptional regulator
MKKILLLPILTAIGISADVSIGKILPQVTLDHKNGGYFSGKAWNSSMLKDKTTMLMYVDPDEKDKGEVFKQTIERLEREVDFKKFQIVVVLNLGATWKPNMLIKKLMKDKLKTYPKRIYVFDNNSLLVKKWGVKNDAYNVLLINRKMELLYNHSGKWESGKIKKLDSLIRSQIK